MGSDMLEAAAKAIEEELDKPQGEWARRAARAVIVSLMEPTHDVTAAVLNPGEDRTQVVNMWRSMMQSILE